MTTSRFNSNRGGHPRTSYRRINESRGRKALKEELEIYSDLGSYTLDLFTPQSDAAEETYSRVCAEDRFDDLDVILEERYPGGLPEDVLDNVLAYEDHWIYTELGMIDYNAYYEGVLGEVYEAISNIDSLSTYAYYVYVYVTEVGRGQLGQICVQWAWGDGQPVIDMIENACAPFGNAITLDTTPKGIIIRENKNYRESLRSRHITRRPIKENRNTRYTYRYRR